MNMQSLMAQAQKMQKELMKKKDEVSKETFIGKSELVEVTINGDKKVLDVKINATELSSEDLEILQDMIAIATNDAINKVNEAMEKAMGQYGNAFNGLF